MFDFYNPKERDESETIKDMGIIIFRKALNPSASEVKCSCHLQNDRTVRAPKNKELGCLVLCVS